MSQPNNRAAKLAAPGKVDDKIGEFWVENPWEIVSAGRNLSNYERQRFYLNLRGKGFFDLSYLSGADRDSDGRSVIAADFRNVGRLDVVVKHVGGDALAIYENQFPQKHYLMVSLKGVASNRQGIGARIVAYSKGGKVVREMYPTNTHHSQIPNIVHIGLGDDSVIDRLTIRWPAGQTQELTNLNADRHVLIHEDKSGNAAVETIVPGKIGAAR